MKARVARDTLPGSDTNGLLSPDLGPISMHVCGSQSIWYFSGPPIQKAGIHGQEIKCMSLRRLYVPRNVVEAGLCMSLSSGKEYPLRHA